MPLRATKEMEAATVSELSLAVFQRSSEPADPLVPINAPLGRLVGMLFRLAQEFIEFAVKNAGLVLFRLDGFLERLLAPAGLAFEDLHGRFNIADFARFFERLERDDRFEFRVDGELCLAAGAVESERLGLGHMGNSTSMPGGGARWSILRTVSKVLPLTVLVRSGNCSNG